MTRGQLTKPAPPQRAWMLAPWIVALWLLVGCGANSAKKSYVLAEQLWTDGKYAAAVSEFDKVVAKDPSGKLGLMALQRAASTQALFLQQYGEAVRKYRRFAEITHDPAAGWEARKQIGEILFTKTEQYDQAISQYEQLVKLNPDSSELPEFLFRIAKSHFFLWHFDEAIAGYTEIFRRFPKAPWAQRALYEIGVTYFTRGEQTSGAKGAGPDAYENAIAAYERLIRLYPGSEWVSEAKFGIASCLEEMDKLDEAAKAYEALLSSYPSPKVIQIKLIRIRERKTQRNH